MNQLKPTINLWQGIGLLSTTLLGTGVFILPEITAQMAGWDSITAWVLLTLTILPVAYVFAALGKKFPHAAGVSYFVELAMGKRLGTVTGLMFILLIPVGAPAALAITFQFITPLISLSDPQMLVAELGFLALIFLLNTNGLRASGVFQLSLTLAMVATVAVLFLFPQQAPDWQQFKPGASNSWEPISQVMAIGFWSFMGIETMSHLVTEFKRPQKDFVPAMLIGTLLVAVIYVVTTAMMVPIAANEGLAIITLFDQTFGGNGAYVIGILGVCSGFATVNMYCAGVSRLTWSYAKDQTLPAPLAKLNANGNPDRALTLLLGSIATTLVIKHFYNIPFESLLLWANALVVLVYFLAMISAIKLLRGVTRFWALVGCAVTIVLLYTLRNDLLYALVVAAVLMLYVIAKEKKFIFNPVTTEKNT